MKVEKYSGDYDRVKFYGIMGKFFAEPQYKRDLPYGCNRNGSEWYLFYKADSLVGFSSVIHTKYHVKFGNMYVLPEFRNDGVWSYMANYLLNLYRDQVIIVVVNNKTLYDAWKRRKFKEVNERGSYKILEWRPEDDE